MFCLLSPNCMFMVYQYTSGHYLPVDMSFYYGMGKHGLYGIVNVSLSARPPFFVEEETISVCRSRTPSGTFVWY